MKIEAIDIRPHRLPLDPPFRASWNPQPRVSHTSTISPEIRSLSLWRTIWWSGYDSLPTI